MFSQVLTKSWLIRMAPWILLVVYFFGLDVVSDIFMQAGYSFIWWLCLGFLVIGLYKLTLMNEKRHNARVRNFVRAEFLLVGLTLFLYDPTLREPLSQLGLSSLWLITASAFLAFVLLEHLVLLRK